MLPLNNWTNVVHYLRKKQRFAAGRAVVRLEGAKLTREPPKAAEPVKEPEPTPAPAPATT